MRKITQDAITAFYGRRDFKRDNTEVISASITVLNLHGNEIANLDAGDNLRITDAGWSTATTKERLNGLHGVRIVQKDHKWYLNGQEWDGEWVSVRDGGVDPDIRYNIVRFYRDNRPTVIVAKNFTLEEAQEWCKSAVTHKIGKDGHVVWFDGYVEA